MSRRLRVDEQASERPATGFVQETTRIFAPHSLSNVPAAMASAPRVESLLAPGDIVLLRTPGAVYSASRALLSSEYDHAVVALERPDHVLNISPPLARRIPTCSALTALRTPLVLRPCLAPAESRAFVRLLQGLIGKPYDLTSLYLTLGRGVIEKQLKVGRFLPKVPAGGVVCTDAILACLAKASPAFALAIRDAEPPLDHARAGAATPNDFLRLRDMGLLSPIALPDAKLDSPNQAAAAASSAQGLEDAWRQARTSTFYARVLGGALLLLLAVKMRAAVWALTRRIAVVWLSAVIARRVMRARL